MNQVTTNPMEWHYYTNKAKKRKIDELLKQAANLFANCGPTAADRNEALEKEKKLINEIAKIDRHFAERCGWQPN
jgi:RecB family exonuclease